MDKILLLLEHKKNRSLLEEWLAGKYQIVSANTEQALDVTFDLGILDGVALNTFWKNVQTQKEKEKPVFLPFLMVTSRHDVSYITRYLWQTIDELILTPIERLELQARVEILLQARRLSLKLKLRNEELKACNSAMAHDLRAPLRAIGGFTQALFEDKADKLDEEGIHYLQRIQSASEEMRELIDVLLGFSRLGHDETNMQPIDLHFIVERCMQNLEPEINERDAHVVIKSEFPKVRGNRALLKIVFQNLLSNAIEYVAPEVKPQVTISAVVRGNFVRVQIKDNGIGIAPENQQRIFEPFVRLHGVEEYPGFGLGLSGVRKAVELMGGEVGVESELEQGSTFWLEFPLA